MALRRPFLTFLVALGVFSGVISSVASREAAAQTSGFSLSRFDPAERGSDWFLAESLDLRGHIRPGAGAVFDWGYRPLVIYNNDGSEQAALVRHQLIAHLGGTLVFWDRLRVALDLPVALFLQGQSGQIGALSYTPPKGAALGDLRVGADVRIVGSYGAPFQLAAGVQLYVPSGNRAAYMSDGTVRFSARAMVAGDLTWFVYALRLGFQFRPLVSQFDVSPLGSELSLVAAIGGRLAGGRVTLGPEVAVSTVTANPSGLFSLHTATNFEALLGAHWLVYEGVRIGLGAGPGLSHGLGTPELRVVASAEWSLWPKETPEEEAKRKAAEIDDARRADAARRQERVAPPPPPGDRDRDGVQDKDDACPDQEGLQTKDPRTNGCPDSDGDGIYDNFDACPFVSGIKTDNVKTNGCPADRDADGIPDVEDACPAEAGPRSEDRRINGCPDRDHDGIIDRLDACPNEPGGAWSDPTLDGCPAGARPERERRRQK